MAHEASQQATVAVFDINGTLIEKNFGVTFVKHLFTRGLLSWWTVLKILSLYPLVRLGWVDFRYAIAMGGWALAGLTPKQAEAEAQHCFDARMRHHLYPQGLAEIDACKQRGMHILLATGGVASIAEVFGRHIEADGVIAAQSVRRQDGALGSKLLEPLPYREGKRDLVLDYIRRELGSARLVVYSDKVKDMTLLQAADEPVAVNGDAEVTRYVQEKGGRILNF